ncbi:hypothetical protein CEXT_130181 [Caerostris extrusa]|uniref:Uncharacterized protein n=1 Tax=Caerostris extrusa TaxID=172846 RepID=A0AAV4W148_CAEEX|nr:hypothetical protein CEXT_130181 [Caerostris extrusa]
MDICSNDHVRIGVNWGKCDDFFFMRYLPIFWPEGCQYLRKQDYRPLSRIWMSASAGVGTRQYIKRCAEDTGIGMHSGMSDPSAMYE